jgi:hypothetical protein
LDKLHPSRSEALAQTKDAEQVSISLAQRRYGNEGRQPRRRLTKAEKLALADEQRKEQERNQKERERKIKQREKMRKDFQKMTSKGQPVMRSRLEHLLTKVKKVMKED